MNKNKTATQIARENSRLSAAQLATLTGTCTIQRKTQAEDGTGGQTETWATLAANVACASNFREQPRPVEDVGNNLGVDSTVHYYFQLPSGQDVKPRDRIVHLGFTFEVLAMYPPVTVEPLRELECVVIR